MTDMFSGFSEARNTTGQTVISFGAPIGIHLISAVAGPLVGIVAIYFFTRDWQMGIPWWIYAAIVSAGCLSIAILLWFDSLSWVRVTVDRQKSFLAIATRRGNSELPMRDIASAAIDSNNSGRSTTYRLQFVLRNGECVPATSSYFNFYREADRKCVVEAINRELGARAEMM
jgi:hypothetical protein